MKNQLIQEIKSMSSVDPWGDSLNALFGIAGELWHRGFDVPPHWEYCPGATNDPRDQGDSLFEIFQEAGPSDLEKAGEILNRYCDKLRAKGLDY